ncbi:MAG: DapH/DapD/GlmU-related protein [Anaerosomatales bacterium]|nr:DapH/DapD/GlmU-related protein [Anaerosomatales bacterium]
MESRISAGAHVGRDFACGAGCVVHDDVSIGDGVTLGNHVIVYEGTELGDGVNVADFAVLGKQPRLGARSTAKSGSLGPLRVGAGTSVGSHTVLMAGTTIGERCIVGDNAGVRERCRIGDDVIVGRAVTVENATTIGDRTRIQTGAYITAYVTLEEDVFIAPMVVTTNDNYMGRTEKRLAEMKGCTVRRRARVGGGVHILPGVEIGEEAFIATGAIVTRDIPPRVVAMGVPARPVRDVPAEELLENQ